MAPGSVSLASIRRMLEGVIPGVMCTVSRDGTPHLCFLSQADYVDEEHVALSFQFFNRSRQNILATRRAALTVDDPYTAGGVRLDLEYLRTETSGPLFQRMNAKLAGIASHSGMDKVFRLQGADIYRVHAVQRIEGRQELAAPQPRCELQPAIRALSEELTACTDMAQLLDTCMRGLRQHLLIDNAILMVVDARAQRLYTVASAGYDSSGVGAEIAFGEGVAGIAAREGVPIRVGHLSLWQVYGRAMRQGAIDVGLGLAAQEEIPLPGLAEPRSQMAVPLRLRGRVEGVLLMESSEDQHFSYDDEDAVTVIANQLALQLQLLQPAEAEPVAPAAPAAAANTGPAGSVTSPAGDSPDGPPAMVRHHAPNDSVFVDGNYLIKGVAGAIFRKVVAEWLASGRTEFNNRELRLDPALKLPDVADNLEVRLVLLQRRLADRGGPLRIEKTGRGRFRIVPLRPLHLESLQS